MCHGVPDVRRSWPVDSNGLGPSESWQQSRPRPAVAGLTRGSQRSRVRALRARVCPLPWRSGRAPSASMRRCRAGNRARCSSCQETRTRLRNGKPSALRSREEMGADTPGREIQRMQRQWEQRRGLGCSRPKQKYLIAFAPPPMYVMILRNSPPTMCRSPPEPGGQPLAARGTKYPPKRIPPSLAAEEKIDA